MIVTMTPLQVFSKLDGLTRFLAPFLPIPHGAPGQRVTWRRRSRPEVLVVPHQLRHHLLAAAGLSLAESSTATGARQGSGPAISSPVAGMFRTGVITACMPGMRHGVSGLSGLGQLAGAPAVDPRRAGEDAVLTSLSQHLELYRP